MPRPLQRSTARRLSGLARRSHCLLRLMARESMVV